MIQVFPGISGPIIAVMLATLPLLIGIQEVAALVASGRRRQQPASPQSKAMRGLIKALSIPPTTISFTIEVTARDLPTLTVVREVTKGEVDSITDWIRDGRIQTVEQTYNLEPSQ